MPPAGLRELRELTRTRLVLTQQRTRLKNRIGATLSKYGLAAVDASDAFGKKARPQLEQRLRQLPEQARWVSEQLLSQLDFLMAQVAQLEKRLRELVRVSSDMQLLQSLPGVGEILAPTIALEIGDIDRFLRAERLASYSGTTPRVHASGGKVRYGHLRSDVNRYLKWAFVEAANSVAVNYPRYEQRHVSRLYRRLRERKGHHKAIGAVARHLAEAAFYVLRKQELYRDPADAAGCATEV
jgi:transposase